MREPVGKRFPFLSHACSAFAEVVSIAFTSTTYNERSVIRVVISNDMMGDQIATEASFQCIGKLDIAAASLYESAQSREECIVSGKLF